MKTLFLGYSKMGSIITKNLLEEVGFKMRQIKVLEKLDKNNRNG